MSDILIRVMVTWVYALVKSIDLCTKICGFYYMYLNIKKKKKCKDLILK